MNTFWIKEALAGLVLLALLVLPVVCLMQACS